MPGIDNYSLDNYGVDGPSSGNQEFGDGPIFRRDTLSQTQSSTPKEVIGIRFNKSGGSVRVKFSLARQVGGGNTAYARVYLNDVAYGPIRSSTETTSPTAFEDTVTFAAGDKISIYIWVSVAASGNSSYLSKVSLLSDFLTIVKEVDSST